MARKKLDKETVQKVDKNDYTDLFEAIAEIETVEQSKAFLLDLCTVDELCFLTQRIRAAKFLINGETYEEIIEKTGISSATLARISHCVKYGEGYSKVLKKENK